jgi:hypothetical protein
MKGIKEMTLMDAPVEAAPEDALARVPGDPAMLPMIERLAALPDFDVAKLEKLLDMQERVLNRQAETAFNVAFVDLQAEIPTIIERSKTDKGKYAPREDIVDIVRPILKAHGFTLGFRTEWPDGKIQIVGILTHRDGHSRESKFLTDADTSGSKNAIQARGSAVEYGRRYTTTDLLNIATRGGDDDGRRSGKPEPPEGFDKYWKQLADAADQGTKALEAVWACSADEPYKSYRAYAALYGKSEMDALRAKARRGSR